MCWSTTEAFNHWLPRHLPPKNFEKTGLKKGGHNCGNNCTVQTFVFQTFMLLSCRLVDWEEGNYRVTDQPRPRGEVKHINLNSNLHKCPGLHRGQECWEGVLQDAGEDRGGVL